MKICIRSIPLLTSVVMLTAACGVLSDPIEHVATQPITSLSGGSQDANEFDTRIITATELVLDAINRKRAERGAAALVSTTELSGLAFTRATDLAVRAAMSHKDPGTGAVAVEAELAQMGYAGPAAELLFASPDPLESVPERVIDAWFADPMHKALLLEPSFRYCGIGMMGDGDLWKVSLIITVNPLEEAGP